MKQTLRLICIVDVLCLLLFPGCENAVTDEGEANTTPATSGQIRFIHTASSTGALDLVYFDPTDNYYYVIENDATYGNAYGYFDFYTGNREIFAYQANTSIVLAAATIPLMTDEKYSVIGVDYEATLDPSLLVVADTLSLPQQGFSFVRFINTITDRDAIRITENDSNVVIASLNHLGRSPYSKLSARTFKFEIWSEDSQYLLLELNPVTFLSGHCYTMIVSGTTSDLTPVPLNARLFRETSL
jgi:hypothetical protein